MTCDECDRLRTALRQSALDLERGAERAQNLGDAAGAAALKRDAGIARRALGGE